MLVCNCCGTLVKDEDVRTLTDCHGYTDLREITETFEDRTCECGGDLVEATKCEVCGEYFFDEYNTKVCEVCFDENVNFAMAEKIGSIETVSSEINGFIASVYSIEKINDILIRHAMENYSGLDKLVARYCEKERDLCADIILEEIE